MTNVNRGKATWPFLFFLLIFSLQFFSVNSKAASNYSNKRHFSGFAEDMWGLGIVLGDPTGVRAVNFIDWKRAWSYTAAYSFSKVAQVSADYLFYGYKARDRILDSDFFNSLIFYGGVGAMAGYGLAGADTGNNYQIALRAVGGVEYLFVGSPWSLRLEGVPELFLKGSTSFAVGLGMGITYYWFDGGEASGSTRLREKHTETVDESEFEDGPRASTSPPTGRNLPGITVPKGTPSAVKPVTKPPVNSPGVKPKQPPAPAQGHEFDEFN